MVIAKITSGLGNQLFQYAAARSLSFKNNTSLYLDTRYYNQQYNTDTLRIFKLNCFNIDCSIFNNFKTLTLLSKSTKLFPNRTFKPFFQLVNEKQHHFDESVLDAKAAFVYMKGYWQSEKYFLQISDVIRKELSFKPNIKADFLLYKNTILNSENSVSIHIRRGDYVNHPQFSNSFGFIGLDYYLKAIEMIKSKFSNYKFFVFSDDHDWVEKNFPFSADEVFVKTDGSDTDIDDLQLMSTCKNHIIANSSYSWWGAWLNPNPEKLVIAPARLYKNQPDWNTQDLIPDTWVKI